MPPRSSAKEDRVLEIKKFLRFIEAGNPYYRYMEQDPIFCFNNHRTMKVMQEWALLCQRKARRDVRLTLRIGPTGVGKTYDAIGDFENTFVKPVGDAKWWDGYCGEHKVVWDEMGGRVAKVPLDLFLVIVDQYPIVVETKGGSVPALWGEFEVTTNIHPNRWWNFNNRMEHYLAVKRRFSKIVVYDKNGNQRVIVNDGSPQMQIWWRQFWDSEPICVTDTHEETHPDAHIRSERPTGQDGLWNPWVQEGMRPVDRPPPARDMWGSRTMCDDPRDGFMTDSDESE